LVTPTASQGSAQPLKPAASAMPPPTGTSTTPPTTGVTVAEHGRAPSPAATLLIGHETTHRHRPVGLSLAELGGHLAIIADAKRGKTTLAARILEQTLAHGLPVVAVDHDGQLSGYVEATPVQLAGAHVSLHLPANEGDQPLADPANTGRNAASPAVADAPPRLTLFSTARLPSDAARAAWLSRGLQSLAESGTRQRVAVPGGSLRGLLVLDAVDVCLEQAPGGAAALHRLLGDPELGFAVVLTARGGGVVSGLGESVATWLFGRLMRRSDREASAALHRRGLRFNPAKLSMQERGRFLLVREGQPGKTLQAELPAVMPNTPDGDMLRRRAGAVGG